MATAQSSFRFVPSLGFFPKRTFWATVGLVILLAAWNGYGMVTAPSRIGPALQEQLAQGDSTTLYDISVELPFAPRQFHIKLFQSYGTFAGTDGTTVKIRRVDRAHVEEIARKYWVTRVDAAQFQ